MCGICGVVARQTTRVSAERLTPMLAAMTARGPDGEGVWCNDRAALGHRRLAIIDLAGGAQPLGNEDGSIQAVVNGEIYNFVSLREELKQRGHLFRTASDSEVVVHGWEQWGQDFVHHLEGMFALAVMDTRERLLFLARDRFGKKPLYWHAGAGEFVFASTLGALLRHPAVPRELDVLGLQQYLAFGFVPAPASAIRGVRKLPAGHTLVLRERGEPQVARYFAPGPAVSGAPPPVAEVEARLRQLLLDATRKRLAADVPVGVFLSGGIDSGAVVGAASRVGVGRLRTFSIGFEEASFDERRWAREVSQQYGTDHSEETLTPSSLLELVPRLGAILDEPLADSSIVPTSVLSRLARRSVTVALGGDGGDELFGGYPTYLAHRWPIQGPWPRLARRIAARLPVTHADLSADFLLRKWLVGAEQERPLRNYFWLGIFEDGELPSIFDAPLDHAALLAPIREAYLSAPGQTHLDRVLHQDQLLYLGQQILTKVDRASMAFSLEVRAPFLDTALAAYANGLPDSLKVRGWSTKWILKRAFRSWLPRSVLSRRKKGFSMPVAAWLRGPLRELARALLLDTNGLCDSGRWSRSYVERLLRDHQTGSADHRQRIWALMALELWRREHRVSLP